MSSTTPSPVRARRFEMSLPVRYRLAGEVEWSPGLTLNISRSGILLRTPRIVAPATPLEMEVVLPGDAAADARVISRGTVMRTLRPDNAEHDRAMAVTIDTYDLVRSSRTPAA